MMLFRKKQTEKNQSPFYERKIEVVRSRQKLLNSDFDLQPMQQALTDYRIPAAMQRQEALPAFPLKQESKLQEKRGALRIATDLTGGYLSEERGYRGLITIENISRTGMRIKLNARRRLHVNDIIIVKFNLDNIIHLLIQREVMIRNTDDIYMGVEFCYGDVNDGLYPYLGN